MDRLYFSSFLNDKIHHMKPFLMFLIVLCFLGGQSFFTENKTEKTALIVAISEYAENTGWSKLSSDNDVDLVRHALLTQGFVNDDIQVLENEQATKNGIIEAIEKHLIQKAKRGGIAVFHFSGHGQQIQDTSADELDGLDEALVPYDSPQKFKKGIYEGKNLLRDDELGALIQKLRRKLGKRGQVLVVLDACHSGTGTRGFSTARGTDIVMADSLYLKNLKRNIRDDNRLNSESPSISSRELAPMVSFFGAGANQLNYETISSDGQSVGSLSYAFSQAFSKAKKETSYRALFEKIQLNMASLAPNQSPQSEGDLDIPLLGGELLGKVQYFKIPKGGWETPTRLSLEEGTLSGLFPGTTLRFFPPDTRRPEEGTSLASGKVIHASPFTSLIELSDSIRKEEIMDAWIFIDQQHFGDLSVRVKLELSRKNLEKKVIDQFSEFPVIGLMSDKPDLLLQTFGGEKGQDSIRLVTTHAKILYKRAIKGDDSSVAWQVLQSILAHVQCSFLRGFDMKMEEMNVQMELLSFKDTAFVGNTGQTQFTVGEKFKIRISNNGLLPVYFTVIDIQPNNEINIIIPAPGSRHTSRELFLQPGAQMDYQTVFEIMPPFGSEVLKLIATLSPIDLSPIASTRGSGMTKSGTVHPFEKLFSATYLNNQRGSFDFGLGTMIHVDSKVFEIEKGE